MTSSQDLAIYKQQLVLVYKPDGVTFIDVLRDAPLLAGFKEATNSATTPLQVTLPRSFDSFDQSGVTGATGTIGQGNVVKYYLYGPGLPASGKLRYQGVIDAYQPQIADTGEETVVITIVPQGSVLADHGLKGNLTIGVIGGAGQDTVAHFNYWFNNNDPTTGVPYASPLTLASGNPGTSGHVVSYTYSNENLASIWTTILQMSPLNWFFRINVDNTVVFNVAPTTAQHMLILGQHVSSISYSQDWTQLKNVIYVTGNGSITATATGSDLATYGERLLFYNDSRITDATTATTIANGLLAQYDVVATRTTMRVLDYRGDVNSGLGYDIETLQVGDTCQIYDPSTYVFGGTGTWDSTNWDASYWDFAPGTQLGQVGMIVGLTYNFDYVDMEVAIFQPSQDTQLFNIRQRLQDFTMAR